MGRAVGFEPFFSSDFVRADDRTNLVIENLRSGAGERLKSGVFETTKVRVERLVEASSAFGNFKRGESVYVDFGHSFGNGASHIDVIVSVEVGMNAALQTHFSCP
ncbi:unannotated protein [freshwater metagenome]|uniref:Unannotated protein n=1 Tax=freshwater metagenome TaxID=449393 RepID=A0A6J6Y6T0_9ZZZZ